MRLDLRFDRLRLRGPSGAKDEFLLAATAQNLRKLAKLIHLPAPIMAAGSDFSGRRPPGRLTPDAKEAAR
jgi:hypothetical protein